MVFLDGDDPADIVQRACGHRMTARTSFEHWTLPRSLCQLRQPGTSLFATVCECRRSWRIWVSRASWNQAYPGLEPRPGAGRRGFIRYWLEHLEPNLGAIARITTQDDLTRSKSAICPSLSVSLRVQRAIADYLDRETARIDALIAAKRRMVELLEERFAMQSRPSRAHPTTLSSRRKVEVPLWPARSGSVRRFNPSVHLKGVPFLHGSHLTEADIVFDPPTVLISALDSARLSESRLRAGDVVVVRSG